MTPTPDRDRPLNALMQAAGLVLDDVQRSHAPGRIDLGTEHHQPWGVVRQDPAVVGNTSHRRLRPKPSGWSVIRLTTVGRRTGRPRAVLVCYVDDGDDFITMAMNGWGPAEPAWWLNLRERRSLPGSNTDKGLA
jgi:hypothetical protein